MFTLILLHFLKIKMVNFIVPSFGHTERASAGSQTRSNKYRKSHNVMTDAC